MRHSLGAALALAVAFGGWARPAEAARSLQVKLPFAFGAGEATFPKGRCKFELTSSTKVSIQCSGAHAVVSARTLEFRGDAFKATQVEEMTFRRYGDRYFLSEIWIATDGRQILESQAEKALAEKGVVGRPVKLKVK